ncbi:hypothetical protein QR680_003671 [Steinernema hermaphroditum]|uniref:DUF19 domain-containing protein n=1 Tax=Steinernema hermaphroditum TaxID=289476 RepID=A0AA39HL58_9BILA|nr:hypothetical protein QR680_003671 [Steinernema hermaphroditum]
MKLIALVAATIFIATFGSGTIEATRSAPYVPDKCNYDSFLRFEHKYKSRCEDTDHYHFHKDRHYLNLMEEFQTLAPEKLRCHFIAEVKDFLDAEGFTKCSRIFHYFAASRSCVEEAETDTSAEFGECMRHLAVQRPEKTFDCKAYVQCVHRVYLDKCGKRALAMTCDRYIATFRDLDFHLGVTCDSWDDFFAYCETVTPY